jgi:hypothetical protein
LFVVVAAALVLACLAWSARPRVDTAKTRTPAPAPAALDLAAVPRFPLDDAGYDLAIETYYVPRIKDPLSLEAVRHAYHHAGYRGIGLLKNELGADRLPPEAQMDHLLRIAALYLYEGEPAEACATLARIRAMAEQDPRRFRAGLPTVIFYQGLASLRRGETENCVECQCRTSCICPIDAPAVHLKTKGSRDAVAFFSEYLRDHPDDLEARWLLNIAYMTLGEYPGAVPPRLLIPPRTFGSEMDVGRFTDIAAPLGVNRLNQAGGAVMDDFDNDGLLDIVTTSMDPEAPMAFFRNKGDGTFEDRSKETGLLGQLGGLYCVQTDYNNDGWLDIFVPRGGWISPIRPSLLRNNKDGTFTDVTAQAGLLTPITSQVAAWGDYDNDGHLDLFLGGELERSRLYRNKGDGTFEDVAERAGVTNEGLRCKGACWGDFDGDGYLDLLVSNFTGPPRLYHNNRDGTFTEVSDRMGIRLPARYGFSCWFFDYDNDGWPDIFIAGFDRSLNNVVQSHLGLPNEGTSCRLYRNLEGKGFEDVTQAVGLDKVMSVMGSNFMDVDNDGFLDIYLGTGSPQYSMLVPNRLFKNVDGRRFVDITTSSGTGHLQKGHAVAAGDWDQDGNVDIFEQLGGATPGDRFRNVLFQNPGHPEHHWLTVKLVGQKTNRAAIGARIRITPAGSAASIYRHVTSGSSFGGNPLRQTIGIGKAKRIAELEIFWPTSRTRQVFRDLPANQSIEIIEFAADYRRLPYRRLPVP